MDKKKRILEFIKKHTLTVISTVNKENNPESAVIEFAATDNLELVFDTFSTFRKYSNIQRNPHVSFVIGWDESETVQYEGVAVELQGEELEKYKKIFFAKLPDARKFENQQGIVYFKVLPKWIRFSNLSQHPWEVFEVSF